MKVELTVPEAFYLLAEQSAELFLDSKNPSKLNAMNSTMGAIIGEVGASPFRKLFGSKHYLALVETHIKIKEDPKGAKIPEVLENIPALKQGIKNTYDIWKASLLPA